MSTEIQAIIDTIKHSLCTEIEVQQRSDGTYSVYTPMGFDDGDSYVVTLQRQGNREWSITDNGSTFMHLTYAGVDLRGGTRRRLLDESFAFHGIEVRNGVLIKSGVKDELLGYAVFSFLHALAKSAHVAKLTKSVVRSAFIDDVRSLLANVVPASQLVAPWTDKEHDVEGLYPADFRIVADEPWLVFAIGTTDKCKEATIACLKFNQFELKDKRLALFHDQSKVARHSVLQLTDVIDKQFTSLGDKGQVERYIKENILKAA